jgi:hypothetical protein
MAWDDGLPTPIPAVTIAGDMHGSFGFWFFYGGRDPA